MLFLAIVAVLTGLLTTFVIRRTTNASALRMVRGRIYARLLEFRLFFDEPQLIWQAQVSLLRENARLLWLLLTPTVLLALPMTWLVLQLDSFYGIRPLRAGEPAVVTAQLTRPIARADRFDLHAAGGINVETSPIRHHDQVYWRIRPTRDAHGAINLTFNGRVIRKTVAAGNPPQLLSPRRNKSLMEFLLHPEEPRLPEGDIAWMEVDYPATSAAWIVWFVVVSTGAALITTRFR